MNNHFDYIDLAKGIGIILVVMSHTVFPVHEAISLFHMPLFFVLAGLTLKIYSDFEIFFLKKIDRIFIPYLFFSIISFCIARTLGYSGNVFNDPLWFLQTLFIALIFCEILLKRFQAKAILFFGGCLVYGWLSLKTKYQVFPYDEDFDLTARAMVFVFIGFYLKDFTFKVRNSRSNCMFAGLTFVVWCALSYISIFVMGASGNFLEGTICQYNIFMFYMTAMVGTLMVVFISKVLGSIYIINWLGKNSLIIMCVHYPFLQWWNPMISSWSFYQDGNLMIKGFVALLSYVAAIVFSCLWIPVFRRFVPRLTGFKPLLSKA